MAPPSTAGVFPMDSSSLFTSSPAPSPMPGMPSMAPQDQVSSPDIIAARLRPPLREETKCCVQQAAPRSSGSQDLASLFTDLDPLGSGKAKPFMDKKDFFNDARTKMKMTGASEDSLTNVGLGFSDSIFEPTNQCVSECPTSRVLSSSYSDQLWATLPPRPLPTIHTGAWEPPRPPRPPQPPPSHRTNCLRVALPPEEGRRSASPSATMKTQNSSMYGSILELEASPRKLQATRNKELREFYYSSQDCDGSSLDSSLNLPPPLDPPPALPERLPKLTSMFPRLSLPRNRAA